MTRAGTGRTVNSPRVMLSSRWMWPTTLRGSDAADGQRAVGRERGVGQAEAAGGAGGDQHAFGAGVEHAGEGLAGNADRHVRAWVARRGGEFRDRVERRDHDGAGHAAGALGVVETSLAGADVQVHVVGAHDVHADQAGKPARPQHGVELGHHGGHRAVQTPDLEPLQGRQIGGAAAADPADHAPKAAPADLAGPHRLFGQQRALRAGVDQQHQDGLVKRGGNGELAIAEHQLQRHGGGQGQLAGVGTGRASAKSREARGHQRGAQQGCRPAAQLPPARSGEGAGGYCIAQGMGGVRDPQVNAPHEVPAQQQVGFLVVFGVDLDRNVVQADRSYRQGLQVRRGRGLLAADAADLDLPGGRVGGQAERGAGVGEQQHARRPGIEQGVERPAVEQHGDHQAHQAMIAGLHRRRVDRLVQRDGGVVAVALGGKQPQLPGRQIEVDVEVAQHRHAEQAIRVSIGKQLGGGVRPKRAVHAAETEIVDLNDAGDARSADTVGEGDAGFIVATDVGAGRHLPPGFAGRRFAQQDALGTRYPARA